MYLQYPDNNGTWWVGIPLKRPIRLDVLFIQADGDELIYALEQVPHMTVTDRVVTFSQADSQDIVRAMNRDYSNIRPIR